MYIYIYIYIIYIYTCVCIYICIYIYIYIYKIIRANLPGGPPGVHLCATARSHLGS